MMNFPTPSYVGQQYSNGFTTYQWDGTGWNIVPQMGPIFIGDSPPANPAIGQEWWRSTNGQLYIWFVDAGGGPGQWVQSAGAAGSPGIWEPIFVGPMTSFTTWSKNDLGAYEQLKLGVDFIPNTTGCVYTMTLSTDNGATWLTSAAYTTQVDASFSSSAANGQQPNLTGFDMSMGQVIMPGVNSMGLSANYLIKSFNKARWTKWESFGGFYVNTSGNIFAMTEFGTFAGGAMVHNAIRIVASQPSSGFITLEGIRA